MRMFVVSRGARARMAAVGCPVCGWRLLDVPYGEPISTLEHPPADAGQGRFRVKCAKCGAIIGIS